MDDTIKQASLASAISGAVSEPLPVSPEEQARRNAVKEELMRLIAVVDRGDFASMIVVEAEPNTFPGRLKTSMWGDQDVLRASAAQVVMVYRERNLQAMAEEEPAVFMPEAPRLIVPGVQS